MTPTNNKLTQQNKESFFAQYWGQEVLIESYDALPDTVNPWQMEILEPSDMLLLKPLSSITDEDAIQVAKLVNPLLTDFRKFEYGCCRTVVFLQGRVSIYFDLSSFTSWSSDNKEKWVSPEKIIHVIDFLRSKEYALPWNGITVEEMVEAGWIKLVHDIEKGESNEKH